MTGENGTGEGTLGFLPGGPERTPALSCPPVDTDADAVVDAADLCPLLPDPSQADQDGDGFGDLCDN